MEKEDSTNWEFVVPTRLKELYAAKDFGRYKAPGGKMPVAFSTTTHSTGGNSGSPVMNANGELIGINFDRNWEGVGGDIQYLPTTSAASLSTSATSSSSWTNMPERDICWMRWRLKNNFTPRDSTDRNAIRYILLFIKQTVGSIFERV